MRRSLSILIGALAAAISANALAQEAGLNSDHLVLLRGDAPRPSDGPLSYDPPPPFGSARPGGDAGLDSAGPRTSPAVAPARIAAVRRGLDRVRQDLQSLLEGHIRQQRDLQELERIQDRRLNPANHPGPLLPNDIAPVPSEIALRGRMGETDAANRRLEDTVAQRARGLSRYLSSNGISADDAVQILGRSSPEGADLLRAIARNEATPINEMLRMQASTPAAERGRSIQRATVAQQGLGSSSFEVSEFGRAPTAPGRTIYANDRLTVTTVLGERLEGQFTGIVDRSGESVRFAVRDTSAAGGGRTSMVTLASVASIEVRPGDGSTRMTLVVKPTNEAIAESVRTRTPLQIARSSGGSAAPGQIAGGAGGRPASSPPIRAELGSAFTEDVFDRLIRAGGGVAGAPLDIGNRVGY